jgi:5-oxoprolinase (ATP-hydrolysing)
MAEVDSIKEVEYMDDGTVIALKLTIDRIARTVEFDFSGTGP